GEEGRPSAVPGREDLPPGIDTPEMDQAPSVPNLSNPVDSPVDADPLPGPGFGPPLPGQGARDGERKPPEDPTIPIQPGSQRSTTIFPLTGGPDFVIQRLPDAEGYSTIVIRGGVQIVTKAPAPNGILDLSADSVIIWRRVGAKQQFDSTGEIVEDAG